jgi:hypothetical protein
MLGLLWITLDLDLEKGVVLVCVCAWMETPVVKKTSGI